MNRYQVLTTIHEIFNAAFYDLPSVCSPRDVTNALMGASARAVRDIPLESVETPAASVKEDVERQMIVAYIRKLMGRIHRSRVVKTRMGQHDGSGLDGELVRVLNGLALDVESGLHLEEGDEDEG